jgi:hypothetical protein
MMLRCRTSSTSVFSCCSLGQNTYVSQSCFHFSATLVYFFQISQTSLCLLTYMPPFPFCMVVSSMTPDILYHSPGADGGKCAIEISAALKDWGFASVFLQL